MGFFFGGGVGLSGWGFLKKGEVLHFAKLKFCSPVNAKFGTLFWEKEDFRMEFAYPGMLCVKFADRR